MLMKSLCSDVHWRHVSNVPAKTLFTAKTHKTYGDNKPRNVHGSQRGPFVPLKRYVNVEIQKHLVELPHMCKDSIDLVGQLEERTFPAGSKFYKFDVDDVYMSGDHEKLAEDCSEIVPREAMDFLLGTQYVRSGKRLAKVKCGSGMGDESSGAVSDWSFYVRAERDFMLTQQVQQEFGIIAYIRYRDDFIIVTNGTPHDSFKTLIWQLKDKCKPFMIKCESISNHGCCMLDIHMSKGFRFKRDRKLDIGMHFKATSQGTVLDGRSCHPAAIHRVWPLARFSAFNARCTSNDLAIEAKLAFLIKMVHGCPNHSTIPILVDFLTSRGCMFKKRAGVTLCSWLVLPYHPRLSGISANIMSTHAQWLAADEHFLRFIPKLSWKINHASLASILAADANTKTTLYRKRVGG